MNDTFFKREFSFFGKNCRLSGNFHLSGPIKIQSQIEGEIVHEGNFELTIEPEGVVRANVRCFEAAIYGEFEGKLVARGKVTLFPTAVVTGSIEAASLIIHPGAVLNIKGNTFEQTVPADF